MAKYDSKGNLLVSLGLADEIADADEDTKVQVEESPDEDKIRFDAAGVERVVWHGKNANGDVQGWWNQQFGNMLLNGSFESWSGGAAAAPDGWALVGAAAAVAREATIIRFGEYSAKVTRSGTNCWLQQDCVTPIDADTNTYWRGRIVTLGCWVYATVASRGRLYVHDGTDITYSSYHTGGSSWEFLTVTHTVHGAATHIRAAVNVDTGNTAVYFDGAILVEGPICPTFAPAPVEHVAGWQAWVPVLTDAADLSGYDVARFYRIGQLCFFIFQADNKNVTTAGAVEVTLPFNVAAGAGPPPSYLVNDAANWVTCYVQIMGGTDHFEVRKSLIANWAGTENGVYIRVEGFYEIA